MARVATPPDSLLTRWRYALRTVNPPPAAGLDPVTRWLVISRAGVLPMTVTAGVVAGLLAVRHPDFELLWWLLSFVGIVLAHVSNNLMNDLFDTDTGLDTDSYPRALYAPHPILSGLISRRGSATATLVVNAADLVVLVVLTAARGWPMVAFALGGFALSVAYTAPPLRLKKRGLGELDVFVVWGPLMVGGTYYAAVGSIPWQVWLASIPYALLCVAVLMGKHVDKIPWDGPAGVKTLPVLLGPERSQRLTQALVVGFYVAVAVCVALGALPWPVVAVVGAAPMLAKALPVLGRPRPDEPPPGFPVWPLWYAAVAFVHTRRAGALLVAGLAVAAIFDIKPL